METKPTGEGTGLGLSLSYEIIIKGRGGEIKVETGKENFLSSQLFYQTHSFTLNFNEYQAAYNNFVSITQFIQYCTTSAIAGL